jgi:hypothetical protein
VDLEPLEGAVEGTQAEHEKERHIVVVAV